MHKTPNLIVIIVCCFFILVSGFLTWSTSPQYSLFTIADYAGSYSQYVSETSIIAVAAFLIPISACVTLMSLPLKRTSSFIGALTGIYCCASTAVALVLIKSQSSELPLPHRNPGIFLCLAAALMLFATSVYTALKRVE